MEGGNSGQTDHKENDRAVTISVLISPNASRQLNRSFRLLKVTATNSYLYLVGYKT